MVYGRGRHSVSNENFFLLFIRARMSWKRKTLLSNCLTPSYYTLNGKDYKTLPIKRISSNYVPSLNVRTLDKSVLMNSLILVYKINRS